MTNTESIIAVTISLAAVVITLLVVVVQASARKYRLKILHKEGRLDAGYKTMRSPSELYTYSYEEYDAYLKGYKDQLEWQAPSPNSDEYLIGKSRAYRVLKLRTEYDNRVSEEKGGKQRR